MRDPIGVSSSVWDSRKVEGVVPLLPHGAKDRAYTNIMCCGVFIPKKCTKFGYPARSPRFSPTWCERVSKSIKKIIAGSQSSALQKTNSPVARRRRGVTGRFFSRKVTTLKPSFCTLVTTFHLYSTSLNSSDLKVYTYFHPVDESRRDHPPWITRRFPLCILWTTGRSTPQTVKAEVRA